MPRLFSTRNDLERVRLNAQPALRPRLCALGCAVTGRFLHALVWLLTIIAIIAGPLPTTHGQGLPVGGRAVRVYPRSGELLNFTTFPSTDGLEQIAVLDSGAHIVIEGVPTIGTIDIATDRLVVWTSGGGLDSLNMSGLPGAAASDMPIEFYMEGNIVFRAGQRVIYANSMYYDVRGEQGVVLDAELLADIPNYGGLVRLKADVLRQVDRYRFQAHDAAVTTSRMGVPRYWLQAENLDFQDVPTQLVDGNTGLPLFDSTTGQPMLFSRRFVQARNNFVYLNSWPVFYWPVLNAELTNPRTYIRRVRLGNDRIFGTQVGVTVDVNQVLGIADRLPGVDWTAGVDYLSERGVGFGTSLDYELPRFLGIDGPTRGFFDAWGINDSGLDNLGANRPALVPESDFRGRVFWQHRQRLQNGLQISGELGYISDRNFLEQYYEHEWDEWKDQTTGIELKWLGGNSSWNLATDFQINDFFTQTSWWPRLDQFQLGQPLLDDRLTWYGHSLFGYAKMGAATRPLDPVDASEFNPLAWEADVEGLRVGGRHEIDLPFRVGAVNMVPYVLGESMHWGQDLNGEAVTRLYGQAGVRASLPMWTVDPTVHNTLWNLNGMAHKVSFEAEFLWADANQDFQDLPLYDPLDDDAIEHFRRRFVNSTFGGLPNVDNLVPTRFDERYYALRYGLQSWVTAPSEIADDLMLLRLAARQRWQTKRGLAGQQRVVDWMTLDTGLTIFPKDDRDNFGALLGLIQYDWRWYVGDRFTLMSDGYADTFDDGLQMVSIGSYMTRPERGGLFLGFRSMGGPFNANLLQTAVNYRMSHKWLATAASIVDFGPTGNIGQNFELTRIGESFLVTVAANIDQSRNNVGFAFAVEPRFVTVSRRAFVGGVPITPAGARGLE